MSDTVVSSPAEGSATPSRRGQSMVEFGLVLPLLLILFLGIADFGRVFAAGITVEAAARNAAEIVAEEYRRSPPGGALSDPAPSPGDPGYYGPLHELGASTVCSEMRSLAGTTFDPDTRDCHVADGDPDSHDWMPIIMICIHDEQDPLCDVPAFGATIPDPECSELLAPISPAMDGGIEDSRYVEVRICYLFTALVSVPFASVGQVWLQKDRAFTVADYPVPSPSIPPPPPPPPPTTLPSDSPSPSPSPSESPSASPSATPLGTPAPTPEETPAPPPTPSPSPTPSPEPSP